MGLWDLESGSGLDFWRVLPKLLRSGRNYC